MVLPLRGRLSLSLCLSVSLLSVSVTLSLSLSLCLCLSVALSLCVCLSLAVSLSLCLSLPLSVFSNTGALVPCLLSVARADVQPGPHADDDVIRYVDAAKSCGFTGLVFLHGLLSALKEDGVSWTPELLANEHPTYYGMLVAHFTRGPPRTD